MYDDNFKQQAKDLMGLSPHAFRDHIVDPTAKIPRKLMEATNYQARSFHYIDSRLNPHSFICGVTGAGKSLTQNANIADAISQAPNNGDKLVVVALKGDQLAYIQSLCKRFNVKLYSFNPANSNSYAWDIQKDTEGRFGSLVSIDSELFKSYDQSSDPFWGDAGQMVGQLLHSAYEQAGVRYTLAHLYNFLNQSSEQIAEIIGKILKNPQVDRLLGNESNAKLREGVITTLAVAAQNFQAEAIQSQNTPLSRHQGLKEILSSPEPAVIVLGVDMSQIKYQKGGLRAKLNIIADWIMARDETRNNQRVRIYLDELPKLGKGFDKVLDLLVFSRSKNCEVNITCQNIGQIKDQFGEQGAATLLANCDIKTVLATTDPATAQWAASIAGGRERLRPSYSVGSTALSVGWNYGFQANLRAEDILSMRKASFEYGIDYFLHCPYFRPAIGNVSSRWIESRKPSQVSSDRFFTPFAPSQTFFRFWNPAQDFVSSIQNRRASYRAAKQAYIAAGENPLAQILRQELWNYFENLSGDFVNELIRRQR